MAFIRYSLTSISKGSQRDRIRRWWYPKDAHGKIDKFSDLPVALRVNVDTSHEPLICKAGERAVRSERDIDHVAALPATPNDDCVPEPKPSR